MPAAGDGRRCLSGASFSSSPTRVLMVTIIVRAAGEGELYLAWAVFAALIIAGVTTALQAAHVGRVGPGHILMTGAGPPLHRDLGRRPGRGGHRHAGEPHRRVVAVPVRHGGVAAVPAADSDAHRVRHGADADCGRGDADSRRPFDGRARGRARRRRAGRRRRDADRRHRHGAARRRRLAAVGAARRHPGRLRRRSLCSFGLYDLRPVAAASWLALPDVAAWPGIDLTPDARFWALLPVFAIVSVVAAIKTSSDGAVIQQASARKPRATDFRLVQGALNASGVGILLSGIAVTPPVIIYLPSSVSLINLTGVAARSVGLRHRRHPVRAGVPAEADRRAALGAESRHGGLSADHHGTAVRRRHPHGVPGRPRSAEGARGGSGPGPRRGVGERERLRGRAGRDVERLARQRDDDRGAGHGPADRVPGADQSAAPAAGGGAGRLGRGRDRCLPARPRGRSGWNAASGERLRAAGEEALECLLQLRGDASATRRRASSSSRVRAARRWRWSSWSSPRRRTSRTT